MKAEDFLRRDTHGNVLFASGSSYENELAKAKKRMDYIFSNSKAGIDEFITHGLTNEAFIKAMVKIDDTRYKDIYSGSLIKRFLNVLSNSVEFVKTLATQKQKSKNAHDSLVRLAQDINSVNAETIKK